MKKLVTIILFFSTLKANAQHLIIISNNKYSIDNQKHTGYIEFNNGEKITGIFEYATDEFPTYNLKSFAQNGKLIKRYKSKDIKKVVLAGSDSSLSQRDSTYFKVLDKSKRFYRQLTFKDIEVYDWLFNVNEKSGLVYPNLLIKKDDQLTKFNSKESFINWVHKNAADKIKWHKDISVAQIIRQLNGMDDKSNPK